MRLPMIQQQILLLTGLVTSQHTLQALPPPVPAEFTASIITVIVAAFVGSLLIPAVLGWFKSKKQTSRLNSFHLVMGSINKDGLNEKDIGDLNKLNQNVSDSYSAGKITSEQYTNLKNEVICEHIKKFSKKELNR